MSEQQDEQDQQNEQDQQPDEQPDEQDYFLKRSTMLPVEGLIYCLDHTLVHEETVNPYGEGEESWCKKENHRTVYYRGHKGDYDERKPVGDGSGTVPVKRRIVTTSTEGLSPEERRLTVRLVRQTKGTAAEAASALRQLFGAEDRGLADLNDMLGQLDSIIDKLDETDESGGG